MPLYEYQCGECGRRFERLQKVNDEPVRECPYCGGAVDRLLGVPALQFKGSGWYVTDYGKGSGGRNESGSAASTSDKESSGPKASSAGSTDGGSQD